MLNIVIRYIELIRDDVGSKFEDNIVRSDSYESQI